MRRSRSWWFSSLTLAVLCTAFATLPGCSCDGSGSGDDDGAGDGPGGAAECRVGAQGGLCVQGRCRVQVPGQALEGEIELTVKERPADEVMAADTLGGFVCEVGPPGLALSWKGSLLVSYAAGEVPAGFGAEDLVGFEQRGERQTIVEGSGAEGEFVRVPFAAAGTYGATAVPLAADAGAQVGVDTLRVYDGTTLARNLSASGLMAAFFDGRRLYVGSGTRLLIWNDGVPDDPSKLPDVVVGKADLVDTRPTASASNFSGLVKGIWSDGERLVVAEGNRVLIWTRVPTRNGQPADLVLGQDNMNATAANGGSASPGPSTLSDPDEVASDGTRLVVSDAGNHRVLIWNTFPQYNRQPADVVIGQESFGDAEQLGGAIKMARPRGLLFNGQRLLMTSVGGASSVFGLNAPPAQNNPYPDFQIGTDTTGLRAVTERVFPLPTAMSPFGAGGLALRDRLGYRVSVFRQTPAAAAAASDFVVGRPDREVGGNEVGGVSASTLFSSDERAGLYADAAMMLVPDETRLLVYRSPPQYDGAPADLVLGQPSFVTAQRAVDYRGVGRETLSHPTGVYQAEGLRVVADRANNRVILTRTESGSPFTIVLGQPTGEAFAPNLDWKSPSAATLNAPEDAIVDDGRLIVADTGNHRVLIWNSLPTADGQPADAVVGQADFAGTRPNRGAPDGDGDGDSDAAANGFFSPSGVAVDGDKLFVSDAANHRVLVFSPVPSANGAAATAALGQPSFSANEPNRGQGWFTPRADGLAWPAGLTVDPANGQLWVADRENNRAVAFATRPAIAATAVALVGQPNFTTNAFPSFYTNGLNNGLPVAESGVSNQTLRRPGDVALAEGRLWVSDSNRNRVLGFALPLGAAPAAAVVVLGQPDFASGAPNGDGLGARSLKSPRGLSAFGGKLVVADADNHRVLTFDAPIASAAAASDVAGQYDFLTNGENRSAPAFGTLDRPTGVAWDGQRLWVVDRDNHRLLAYRDVDAPDAPAELVLGQVDFARSLVNAGRAVGRDTLNGPTDVATDGTRFAVADRDNHRVLLWNNIPGSTNAPPDVVVGQPDFASGQPNAGAGLGAPSAASLSAPEGVFLAGGKLYVADTGNHRVLVFDRVPTSNGAAADRVLCQADFASNLGNRGEPDAAADRCSWPTDLAVVGERLYVADSLNHRLLRFGAGAASGAAAEGVVGQRDFATRSPSGADGKSDARTLNSPVSIESDGVNLFVADAGNNRVLVFRPMPDGTGEEEAVAVLGQPTFATSSQTADYGGLGQPSRLAALPRPYHSTRLFIADTAKNRVLVYDNVLRIEGER
ncbi:MAG TPA: NHL repeat-containing protein [Polyangiaceae bacterium]|nr:NHL repeat-containing protein [Polyangiaceae bacterium]